jgi:DNA-binding transcriptional MerR regulator
MRIGELSRRTGVNPDLLRAWERRYRLLRPRRTGGGTRLYSATDETRVRLMRRYVDNGLPPAQAAEMVTAARLSVRPGQLESIPIAEIAEAHAEMHASLDRFDETSAQRALERLFGTYSPLIVVRDVMMPYLREVGQRWAEGHVSVAQEHSHAAGIAASGPERCWPAPPANSTPSASSASASLCITGDGESRTSAPTPASS